MAMQVQHPLTRLNYERLQNGTVRVSDVKGMSGILDKDGNWISGERRGADPLMCVWVATKPVGAVISSPAAEAEK